MAAFFEYTCFFWWILAVVAVLRCFASASSHDDEIDSSAERSPEPVPGEQQPGTWHRCPHDVYFGGHAA